MIFIHWREFFAIALPLTLTTLFVLLMWQAKRKPLWVRILTAIICHSAYARGPRVLSTLHLRRHNQFE